MKKIVIIAVVLVALANLTACSPIVQARGGSVQTAAQYEYTVRYAFIELSREWERGGAFPDTEARENAQTRMSDILNQYAAEGWELVSESSTPTRHRIHQAGEESTMFLLHTFVFRRGIQ